MSATFTSSATRIRTIARSYTVIVNEMANALVRLADHYGVPTSSLNTDLESVLHALRVWVAVKQLETVTLELLGADGRLIRKWQLELDWSESGDDDEQYETNWDQLQAFLDRDRPPGVVQCRVLMSLNTPHPVAVPGWKRTKYTDDAHLQRHEVAATLVGTKHGRASAVIYLDPPHQTKD